MSHALLPTTVVGSYPQPDWLVDRDILTGRSVPRVHANELWRPAPEVLEQAQDDATLLAMHPDEVLLRRLAELRPAPPVSP